MTNAVLFELQYLPPVQYFSKLAAYPVVWLERQEHYAKGSYRNRCHIAGANGVQRLSIPLRKGKNERQPISQTAIAYDEPWSSKHWHAIRSAYSNSPFFEHYAPALKAVFDKKYTLLWDLNFSLLKLLMELTGVQPEIRFTDTWRALAPAGIADLRDVIHPKKSQKDEQFFAIPYAQVFEDKQGFLPNLSTLDLLFCCGPEAGNVLKASFVGFSKLH
ncbi:MAG: WbqC family protein [Saprospiraceae bacterium]